MVMQIEVDPTVSQVAVAVAAAVCSAGAIYAVHQAFHGAEADGGAGATAGLAHRKKAVSFAVQVEAADGTLMSKEEILNIRTEVSSKAQSVSYANSGPLLIMKGRGQYLIDETGTEYLDTRNNVAHVGHAHPRVADAVARQVRCLNTNTRYLHPNHALLAKRLLATFPAPLGAGGKVFFVNSGSEANDLALRLARAHTKRKDAIVVSHAYHGHTCDVIGISPYKYKYGERGGLDGQPDWVTEVPAPDTANGEFRGPDAAERYAETVQRACDAKGGKMGAFFIESGMSVAGVIIPPKDYLKRCYAIVRGAGGVCIADEVQTGFGRVGTHWWAFEQYGVVPDIVTMGKPFGNGMPLAAVVCTKEVAASFENGVEYFNTFGGNPVCCAAGLAVLDVITTEQLMDHAKAVGEYLHERFGVLAASLAEDPNAACLVGDVRGTGLFVGVEFSLPGEGRSPATLQTSWLCSQLKERHNILTSVDGPKNNVLVIKPPMVFNKANVDTLVAAATVELKRMNDVDPASMSHTPT